MAKYNYDFKLQVVKSYLNEDGGYNLIAKIYGIHNISQVQRWVKIDNSLGEDRLKNSTLI